MKKSFFIFVFLLLGLASSAPLDQFFRFDCDGSVTLMVNFFIDLLFILSVFFFLKKKELKIKTQNKNDNH